MRPSSSLAFSGLAGSDVGRDDVHYSWCNRLPRAIVLMLFFFTASMLFSSKNTHRVRFLGKEDNIETVVHAHELLVDQFSSEYSRNGSTRTNKTESIGYEPHIRSHLPLHVPEYPVRRDHHSHPRQSVGIDRLKLIKKDVRYSLQQYKELLQCAEYEPEIDFGRYLGGC
jgi:hypothetical protein